MLSYIEAMISLMVYSETLNVRSPNVRSAIYGRPRALWRV